MSTTSTTHFFDPQELCQIDPLRVPKHVAIIMDGNRRWAELRSIPVFAGHREGAEILTNIVQAAIELGITTLTMYAFSTENWTRSEEEVDLLMQLFDAYLAEKKELMIEQGVKLDAIGDLAKLPLPLQKSFENTKKATQHCDRINLVLALNYGGRDEIRRAIVKIVQDSKQENLSPEKITEEYISKYLDTTLWGDPELLIRTSGELRLSNFLLWQISYAELYVTDVLWPDFSPKNLLEAVLVFQKRNRRRGGDIKGEDDEQF